MEYTQGCMDIMCTATGRFQFQEERLFALHDGILDCAKLVAARTVRHLIVFFWTLWEKGKINGGFSWQKS